MNTVYRVMEKAGRIVRSRGFSVAVLTAICSVMIAYVSLNMNAVTVKDGDSSKVVLTMQDTVQHALSDKQQLENENENDDCQQDSQNQSQNIADTHDIRITADGVTTFLSMPNGTTVEQALEQCEIDVSEFDKTNCDLNSQLSCGQHIEVSRVEYEEFIKTESIPFKTEVAYTSTLAKGKSQMRRSGENGVKTYTYRKCFEDGKEVATKLVKEEITKKPVSASKLVGTVTGTPASPAPIEVPLDEAGQPINYKKKLTGETTAYTSDRGDAGPTTAWAGRARVGVVAVDPRVIPYGTKLYITSKDGSLVYGYAIAGDTGGALRSGRVLVDVFFNTYEECRRYGRRDMNVYVLN